jgi:hypothetical protein
METNSNYLTEKDPETNALVSVVKAYSPTQEGKEVDGNYLVIRDPETNALVPVVHIEGNEQQKPPTWGTIIGDLSDQLDLKNKLVKPLQIGQYLLSPPDLGTINSSFTVALKWEDLNPSDHSYDGMDLVRMSLVRTSSTAFVAYLSSSLSFQQRVMVNTRAAAGTTSALSGVQGYIVIPASNLDVGLGSWAVQAVGNLLDIKVTMAKNPSSGIVVPPDIVWEIELSLFYNGMVAGQPNQALVLHRVWGI